MLPKPLNPRKNIGKFRQLAIDQNRTVFTSQVISPIGETVLKRADNNSKLGNGKYLITKGKWKGFPLFYLTLEERKTCPTYCHFYDRCYGNNLYLAKRFKHGKELENKIEQEIAYLADKYTNFVVRLHILGDFYHPRYVILWSKLLNKYPGLNLFGYTALKEGPIYNEIKNMIKTYGYERAAIRFSYNHSYSKIGRAHV